jgi:FkbM family methyltransferase
MKIFIDIGAYNGDTLNLALQYNYDVIHCFEPVKQHYTALMKRVSKMLHGPSVTIHPYGLLDQNAMIDIHSPGSDGASIYSNKKQFSQIGKVESCSFRDAGEVFRVFHAGDNIDLKINCEGAERLIIQRLIDTGRLKCVSDLCIHYDVLKIPGMGQPVVDELEKLLDNNYQGRRLTVGRNKLVCSDYPVRLDQDKFWVRNWLKYINK